MDLHPAAYTDSKVNAITTARQVGEGWVGLAGMPGSVRHALAWSGTSDSVVDLNQYLPAGYTNAVATGINGNGDIVGYALIPLFLPLFVAAGISLMLCPTLNGTIANVGSRA